MHTRLLNEATINLVIQVQGPLLIKSGLESGDPTRPDMEFVRTTHLGMGRETVYLPGSSLKGTMRSYCEKIGRTVMPHNAHPGFPCDPFDTREPSSLSRYCGQRIKDKQGESRSLSPEDIYRLSCTACRLFGSTSMASRAHFRDAYPGEDLSRKLMTRTSVAIDRVLGSVAVGPFNFEALTEGAFSTSIRLKNFELWQLGLLGLTLRDLCAGRIRIGYAKSRGLGNVSAHIASLELRALVEDAIAHRDGRLAIKGFGALISKNERIASGIRETATLDIEAEASIDRDSWIGPVANFTTDAAITSLLRACANVSWRNYVAQYSESQNG